MLHKININTSFRTCHSITEKINEIVRKSGVRNGVLTLVAPHETVGIVITSFWDPRGLDDLLDDLDRNFPTRVNAMKQDSPYDASGHVKSTIIGNSLNLVIHEHKLILGSSQGIVLIDFDGPQAREVCIQISAKEGMEVVKLPIQTEYMGMHDIRPEIEAILNERHHFKGVVHLSVLHSTAGILLMETEGSLRRDMMQLYEDMVPTRADFKHRETASDAGGHVKTALSGTQLTIPFQTHKLMLSETQSICFAEFDGPRPRTATIAFIEEEKS